MSGKIGVGWSIQLHFQPRDINELREAANLLIGLRLPYEQPSPSGHPDNGQEEGNGNERIDKESLGELLDLAREKKVFLRNTVKRDLHKDILDLTVSEGNRIKRQLQSA